MREASRKIRTKVVIVLILFLSTIITTTNEVKADPAITQQVINSSATDNLTAQLVANQINQKNIVAQSSTKINDDQKRTIDSVNDYHQTVSGQLANIRDVLKNVRTTSGEGALLNKHKEITKLLSSERVSSSSFKYIIQSLGATHNGNPYSAFMGCSISIPENDSKNVLSSLFPNKNSVTHQQIFDEYVKLEEKIAYGTATKEDWNKINGIANGLTANLKTFISNNKECLTVVSGTDLEQAAKTEYEHITAARDSLIQNLDKMEKQYIHENEAHEINRAGNQNNKNKTQSQYIES